MAMSFSDEYWNRLYEKIVNYNPEEVKKEIELLEREVKKDAE